MIEYVREYGGHIELWIRSAKHPAGATRLTDPPWKSLRDLVLVQPYELPTEAGTERGKARERALIEHLGPECFYDHEHHTPPTRLPVLDHLSKVLH